MSFDRKLKIKSAPFAYKKSFFTFGKKGIRIWIKRRSVKVLRKTLCQAKKWTY